MGSKYPKLTLVKQQIIDRKLYTKLQPIVFYLFQFFTGMRPTETRTRLLRDWTLENKEKTAFAIDVNLNGCDVANKKNPGNNFQLKNYSATRRITFDIPLEYVGYIQKFYDLATSLNLTFIFEDLENRSVLSDLFFDSRLKEIKQATQRNCDIYSFRHSFMTYSTKKILDTKGFIDKRAFINLSNMMGHSIPSTSIENYHIDLLELI